MGAEPICESRRDAGCRNVHGEWQREFGLALAPKVWHDLICTRGYTWDMHNLMRVDIDAGERTNGSDDRQDMTIWSLPAAQAGKDFRAPNEPGELVVRILNAAKRS